MIANTPKPPYYAAIFTSTLTDNDAGYAQMADRMVELAGEQPGFLGIESAREQCGIRRLKFGYHALSAIMASNLLRELLFYCY